MAGGQGKLKGKIIRIAHMGYMDALDVMGIVAALEWSLLSLGVSIEPGSAVAAASKEFAKEKGEIIDDLKSVETLLLQAQSVKEEIESLHTEVEAMPLNSVRRHTIELQIRALEVEKERLKSESIKALNDLQDRESLHTLDALKSFYRQTERLGKAAAHFSREFRFSRSAKALEMEEDPDGAEREYRLELELYPRDFVLLGTYAFFLQNVRGDFAARAAVELSWPGQPLLTRIHHADPNGVLRLADVRKGPVTLRLVDGRYLDREYRMSISPGADNRKTIRAEPGFRVFGRVLLPGGKPAVGAAVTLRDSSGVSGRPPRRVVTGKNGRFEVIGLPEHEHLLLSARHTHAGQSYISKQLRVVAGGDEWEVTLKSEDPQLPGRRKQAAFARDGGVHEQRQPKLPPKFVSDALRL